MVLVITLNTMVNMGLVLSVGFKGVFLVTARYVLLAGFWTKKLCIRFVGPLGAGVDGFVVGPFQKLKAWWDIKKQYFEPLARPIVPATSTDPADAIDGNQASQAKKKPKKKSGRKAKEGKKGEP